MIFLLDPEVFGWGVDKVQVSFEKLLPIEKIVYIQIRELEKLAIVFNMFSCLNKTQGKDLGYGKFTGEEVCDLSLKELDSYSSGQKKEFN